MIYWFLLVACLLATALNIDYDACEHILLQGYTSNTYGRIGVWVNGCKVYMVDKDSPAESAGIKKGDVILSANGVKGDKEVDGPAGGTVVLIVRRGIEILTFVMERRDARLLGEPR